MRIGFDVDGVLADFNAAYIDRVIAETGRDLFPVRPFDITTWNYPESYGYTNEEVSRVWKGIEQDPAFWLTLPAYADALALDQRLRDLTSTLGTDVYFITSRPGRTAKAQTEAWLLLTFGIELPTVMISGEKGECAHALKLDWYIDDRNENVADVVDRSSKTRTVMLARPWNQVLEGAPRYSDLRLFLNMLQ